MNHEIASVLEEILKQFGPLIELLKDKPKKSDYTLAGPGAC